MTGMVKETILARQAELGWTVIDGRLNFNPWLLDPKELLTSPAVFSYWDVNGKKLEINLKAGSLAYTICQTPVVIQVSDEPGITMVFPDGAEQVIPGNMLDEDTSKHIFLRDGVVQKLIVTFRIP
jgi:hypothetical protein